MAGSQAVAASKSEVCQKIGAIMSEHIEANLEVAQALTVMKISGSESEKTRASALFDKVAKSQRKLLRGLEEIAELCKSSD
ncbi:hypothetical protein GC1_03025 [Leisingera sp. ANG1]|nr:hypothetical protein RA22_07730 [Leisingera sp. ANG-S]KID10667.1 hypothetical protein GC1_03025 [Leisingera sp. ANG1]